MDFIADVRSRVFAHFLVEVIVVDKIIQVFRDRLVIASVDQETTLAVLDLERNTTCPGCNDRFALKATC